MCPVRLGHRAAVRLLVALRQAGPGLGIDDGFLQRNVVDGQGREHLDGGAQVVDVLLDERVADAEAAVAELGGDPFALGRDGIDTERIDLREIPFVTIDPHGATDLDQAMHLEALDTAAGGAAFRVRYAIADVGRFITPDGPLDAETHARGQTIYLPDRRIPLHPEAISEGAASLLPGVDRAAYVFTVELAADGTIVSQDLGRAVVRSRAQLDYDAIQADADADRPLPEAIAALPAIGAALQADEIARGGIDLAIPDQEVTETNGDYTLSYRPRQGIEDDNAQISLLAGRVAADLMLRAGHGVLRTMPRPDEETIAEFLAIVAGLGFDAGAPYQDVIRSIGHQERNPRALAVHYASPSLFRGAGYTLIGEEESDDELLQAAPHRRNRSPATTSTAGVEADSPKTPAAWSASQQCQCGAVR